MDRHGFPLSPVRPHALALAVLVLWLASLAPASPADACPPSDAPSAADAGSVRVAQLTPIGNAENAIGTLIVRRSDGRLDQLRGRGSLPLYEGDECRTERGSRAFVRLADGTQLAMNEDTTFTVRARTERGRGVVRIFKLLLGEMWMKTPGPTPIEVETPVATAAIKGTEFNLRVLSDGKSILTVIDGMVEFKNEFCSPCPVSAARQSFGERGKRCTEPVPVNPAAVISWIANVVR